MATQTPRAIDIHDETMNTIGCILSFIRYPVYEIR